MKVENIEEFRCAVCDKSFDTFLFEGFPICIPCHNKIIVKEKELESENVLG